MTNEEAKAAFLRGAPVVSRGIEYLRITALIYRIEAGKVITQVEMMDKNNNSVTISRPDRVQEAKTNESE